MQNMIRTLISYILSTSNWILLLVGVTVVSYLFFANMKHTQTIVIDKLEVVHPVIVQNEPLELRFHATINKSGCDMYAERAVTNAVTDETVWQSVSPINSNVIVKEIASNKPIQIEIPNIKPGKYFYYAKVHAICGTTVDIIPTKLLPFTVIEPLNASR